MGREEIINVYSSETNSFIKQGVKNAFESSLSQQYFFVSFVCLFVFV